MALIKIGSDNPDFSYILSKNPQTIRNSGEPFTRPLRKGNIYAWFSKADNSEFKLLFRDSDTEVSFTTKNADFEYLDLSRYASPYAPIGMITKALASALKEVSPLDKPEYTTTLETSILISNGAFLNAFCRHSDGVEVSYVPLAGSIYNVSFTGNSVQKVLNSVIVFCLLQCLYDENVYVPLDDEAIHSFIRALNRIEAPYFLRYLFTRTVFQDKPKFLRFKESIQLPGTSINYGDTRRHRFEAINRVLLGKNGRTLIDVGCGEMFYSTRMVKNYPTIYAYDADAELQEVNSRKIKSRGLDENITLLGELNLETLESTGSFFEDSDVLITEVLEHMDKSTAGELLRSILEKNPARVLVTVPNSEFNEHFLIEEGNFRHDDHKWEPTLAEVQEFLSNYVSEVHSVRLTGIGDVVNGVPTTFMAEIIRKEGETIHEES